VRAPREGVAVDLEGRPAAIGVTGDDRAAHGG
jgi:hypothetical protein